MSNQANVSNVFIADGFLSKPFTLARALAVAKRHYPTRVSDSHGKLRVTRLRWRV
jgi:hypothetical protein